MELDDFKNEWVKYDQKLSRNLKFNEEYLRSINFEKYNQALRKPLNLDLLNILIQFVITGLVISFIIRLSDELPYFLSGIISASICSMSLIFSGVRANRLQKLMHYDRSITDFQKGLMRFRILVKRLRPIEYVLSVILGITLLPVVMKGNSGIDLLGNLTIFIPAVFAVIGLSFAIGIGLNIFVYDKGLHDAERLLKLIENFGKEEQETV